MIELDGSFAEGGGSMLRQALGLSILTGKEFTMNNIRLSRPEPGLAAQHLASLNAAVALCNAHVRGNWLGSTEVAFRPAQFKGGNHKVTIGTAGSITLLLQSLVLPCVFSGKKTSFQVTGGTDAKWSSSFDYFKEIFIPQLRKYADIEVNVARRGYYPKGAGEVKIAISSKAGVENSLPIILLSQKNLLQIRGISHASQDLEESRVAERQAESADLLLRSLKAPISIKTEYAKTESTGSGIALWAVFGDEEVDFNNPIILGSAVLGERTKKAEQVGSDAANHLLETIQSGCAVDEHLADQLIPFLSVVGGVIKTSKITDHVKSNIYVAERFTDSKFTIVDNTISCELANKENNNDNEIKG